MRFKSEFLRTLDERGFLNQCTNYEELDRLAASEKLVAYIGFDCTAKSLHVGNLISILMLRILQKTGHKPIVVMGGATTKVGDPSGKDEARKMLSFEDINENKELLKQNFKKFLKFGEGETDAIMVDNSDWLDNKSYIDFLRDVGKYFTINRMMSFDSVKLRLEREQPLTYLEFSYMLLQAFDFTELYKRYGCRLQMGGSDQWGNLINGMELGKRYAMPELFGLTSHLITNKSGAKMGKTASGAVWLSENMLSPYDYWQFWRNTDDADVIKFLKLFTDLDLSEIEKLSKLEGKELNEAKILLANEATAMCHSKEAAENAHQTAIKTFEQLSIGDNLPEYLVKLSEYDAIPLFKLLNICGLCQSGGDAKRLIKGRGVRINNEIVEDEALVLSQDYMRLNSKIKLSAGQKKHIVIVFAD